MERPEPHCGRMFWLHEQIWNDGCHMAHEPILRDTY